MDIRFWNMEQPNAGYSNKFRVRCDNGNMDTYVLQEKTVHNKIRREYYSCFKASILGLRFADQTSKTAANAKPIAVNAIAAFQTQSGNPDGLVEAD